MSFELILPFLKPIKHLLEAETVSEIMVNPDASVWIEENGQIQPLPGIRFDDGALLTGLEVIANRFGKKLDADSPIMNLRLPDGSRLAALIPPVVNPRPMMTIRKFTSRGFTMADLIECRMLSFAEADLLSSAVRDGRNLLISGGTGSGKTTLLNVLANYIPTARTHPHSRRHRRTIHKEAARHFRRGPARYAQGPGRLWRLAQGCSAPSS